MDRKYPLEALLISRSHTSARVTEILEQRYAVNDKPTISLKPTGEDQPKKSKKGLLAAIKESKSNKTQTQDQTKQVFKEYVQKSRSLQSHLRHKINKLRKQGDDTPKESLKEYKDIPHFSQFLNLNRLWIKYIQDLIAYSPERTNNQQVLTKLASADFNGCFLRVLKSKNSNVVGKAGIVIWDSKNFFIIVEKQDGLKLLEKKGTVFNFVIPLYDLDTEDVDDNDDNYLEFSIIGSRFQYRSADRSGRKFKARNVDDL